jgi:hypothetical protein
VHRDRILVTPEIHAHEPRQPPDKVTQALEARVVEHADGDDLE